MYGDDYVPQPKDYSSDEDNEESHEKEDEKSGEEDLEQKALALLSKRQF